ncbi:MAG: efflux RND transporter periplasmic adaptor subunit [Acidobacteria bacterium]|nr:efflux RND transporter periplasmic adaptor subunit [Acidobacteriota bacterium]
MADAGIAAERDLETARTAFNAADARYKQASAQLEQARASEMSSSTAGLAQAEAQVKQTQAQVRQSEASLKLAEVNLSHTTITSPIDGVVVSRNVDVGQTVAASLSAPTLFTIANDLTQMQVIANIDQADIGAINQENKVSFTVDAYTGRRFEGQIKEIRLSPQNVQNVVTYNVVINVQNPDQKLLPGMTANLTFAVAERKGVLKVPNAALRFTPKDMTPEKIRELLRSQRGGGQGQEQPAQSPEVPQGERQSRGNQQGQQGQQAQQAQGQQGQASENGGRRGGGSAAPAEGQSKVVWVLGADNKPQPRRLRLGISDGTATEVIEGNLQEGETIVVGQKVAGNSATTTSTRPPGFGGAPFGGGGAGGGGRR